MARRASKPTSETPSEPEIEIDGQLETCFDMLERMTPKKLIAVIFKATELKNAGLVKAQQDFIARTRAEAQELQLDIAGLFPQADKGGKQKKSDTRGPVAVKYRDGENTWTGRGRQPKWILAREGEGRSRDEFLVEYQELAG